MSDEDLRKATDLFDQGRLAEAEQLCRQKISDTQPAPGFHVVLGHVLGDRGDVGAALEQFAAAEKLGLANRDTKNAAATLLIQAERRDEAEELLREIVAVDPSFDVARRNLAKLLLLMNQPDAARDVMLPLIQGAAGALIDPEDMALYARALRETDDFTAAGEAYDQGLSLAPGRFDLRLGRAIAWLDGGRAGDAESEFSTLISEQPGDAELWSNLALARKRNGDVDGALAAFDKAIELAPDNDEAVYTRAITRLMTGDFADGLKGFERRFAAVPRDCAWREFPGQRWDGRDAQDGHLLIWQEQGIGDEIMYLSLLPRVAARMDRVTVECDGRLIGLLSRNFPDVAFIAKGELSEATEFDYQIPVASLMRALDPWPNGILPSGRYLEPEPERADGFAQELTSRGDRPRIGIAWRSARRRVGPDKSIPLSLWGPIFRGRDAQFVNLQYGDTDDELNSAIAKTGADIYTAPGLDRFDDIEGLAALIDTLDLVITTSNVTAHLAGALGKECWVGVQRVPLWYWGDSDQNSLFYPTVRMFRQTRYREWDKVVTEIAAALDSFLSQK